MMAHCCTLLLVVATVAGCAAPRKTGDSGTPEFRLDAGLKLGTPRLLTGGQTANDQNPLWSPDGLRLAFTTKRNRGVFNVWMMNADGTSPYAVTSLPAHDSVNMPGSAWCKLNDRIAFSSDRSGNENLWTVKPDGTGAVLVAATTYLDREPTWSPTCDRLVFQSQRNGNWDIYVINADGTGLKRLTTGIEDDWEPNWSPVDDKIVFQSLKGGTWGLWITDSSGSDFVKLSIGTTEDTDASFSPGGKHVVFSTDYGGSDGARIAILEVAAPGSLPTLITTSNFYDGAPAWSPDGRTIAFESDRMGNLDIYTLSLF